jgi:DNA (cytosine-5)-methyltransferase 1
MQGSNRSGAFQVLDLFSGMGGFSVGFKNEGFKVRGIDSDLHCVSSYNSNIGKGSCRQINLCETIPRYRTDILIGGPPCRPWSKLNVKNGREMHPDYFLVDRFRLGIVRYKPTFFILENVPEIKSDRLFQDLRNSAKRIGLSTEYLDVCYADYGAATKRNRLFLFGAKKAVLTHFLNALDGLREQESTVKTAIEKYVDMNEAEFPDHIWGHYDTIKNYSDKYDSGKFGWYRLKWDESAPSFGNISKTYTLHPGWTDGHQRVISVREAMAIMGFDDDYQFPENIGISFKYQMVADAVSPVFSKKCARALKVVLGTE